MGLGHRPFPRSRIYYLDNDVLAAGALEPAALAYLRELKRFSVVRISPTVIDEMAAAPRETRNRLLTVAIGVCNCFTLLQAPEILQLVYALAPGAVLPSIPLRPIGDLSALYGEDPPDVHAFRKSDGVSTLASTTILNDISALYRGEARTKIGSFEDYARVTVVEYLEVFSKEAVSRGHIVEPLAEATVMRAILERKPLFRLILMMAANSYRAITQASLKGCLSDLRTVIETADGDVFLTRDQRLYDCAKLVSDTVEDIGLNVQLLPRF